MVRLRGRPVSDHVYGPTPRRAFMFWPYRLPVFADFSFLVAIWSGLATTSLYCDWTDPAPPATSTTKLCEPAFDGSPWRSPVESRIRPRGRFPWTRVNTAPGPWP